jgi:hypothetical protein
MRSRGDRRRVEWSAVHGTATGSAHRRRHRPCEDAAGALTTGHWTAVAVADGHGSARCPRAARGAALAVEALTRVLAGLPDGGLDEVLAQAGQVPSRLHRAWRELVLAEVASAPLSADELRATGGGDDDAALLAHGTTVLGAAASQRWLVLFQIGDGDILVGRAASPSAGRPVIPVARDDSRLTDSLCQSDAARRARLAVVDLDESPVDVVLVSTDGFGAAFAEPDWHDETARQLVAAAREMGDAALAEAVSGWCDPPARVGGDDVALGVLVARDGASREPHTPRKEEHR